MSSSEHEFYEQYFTHAKSHYTENPDDMEDRFTLEWSRPVQNSGRTDDSVHCYSTGSIFERACAVREFLDMGPQLHKINYIYFAGRLRKFLRTLPDGLSGKIYML